MLSFISLFVKWYCSFELNNHIPNRKHYAERKRTPPPLYLDELVEGLPGALEKLSKLEGEERKAYYRELWDMSEKIMHSWVEEKPN